MPPSSPPPPRPCQSPPPTSPTPQLHADILASLSQTLSPRLPLLHHLNPDSSWLFQIPRPPLAVRRGGGRAYYNILIDPWLAGAQTDVGGWFSRQWHAETSRVGSVREVEELIWRVEGIVSAAAKGNNPSSSSSGSGSGTNGGAHIPDELEHALHCPIDLVVISHEFTDHCHEDTLRQVRREVPVFATKAAADLVRSWRHFHTVLEPPLFGHGGEKKGPCTSQNGEHASYDWRDSSVSPLPEWLGISYLVGGNQALDKVDFHKAVVITFARFENPAGDEGTEQVPRVKKSSRLSLPGDVVDGEGRAEEETGAQCVIYTPHGLPASAFGPIASASPPLETLALIHGRHEFYVAGQQLNLGAKNALRALKTLKAKHWIGTHDELKHGTGIVQWALRRTEIGVAEARGEVGEEGLEEDGVVGLDEVGNGESRVLD